MLAEEWIKIDEENKDKLTNKERPFFEIVVS